MSDSSEDARDQRTIAKLLEELKEIQKTDPVEIGIPERWNRSNPFEDEADEMDL